MEKLLKFLQCCLSVSSGSCDFLAAVMFAKISSPRWTLINQSLGPNLQINIFKPYWESQLLPHLSQMWHSCVRGGTAKSLVARRSRRKEEKPMFWRTVHVPSVLNWCWWGLRKLGQLYIFFSWKLETLFWWNTLMRPSLTQTLLSAPPGKLSLRPLV